MSEAKKDIDVTPEELDRIGKALKDEKFRTLFFDYCKEISDPENRAKYELEIQQLEKERGFDVKFVKPEAGHVIKAIDTTNNEKVFINICTNPNVEGAKVSEQSRHDGKRSVNGENWIVPHILNPPRADVDKAGKECRVCDVMFNPDVYAKATKQKEMMKMLNNIALDSSEEKFNLKLDRHNIKYPKLKYKGRAEATLLRNKDSSNPDAKLDEHLSKFVNYPEVTKASSLESDGPPGKTVLNGGNGADIEEIKPVKENGTATVPRYKIVHRGHFEWQDYTMARSGVTSTRPAELCVEIELPAMNLYKVRMKYLAPIAGLLKKSASGVDLDIIERKLVLNCEKPSYHLEINLPYPVDEDHGTAMFDKSKRSLIVTLPVIKSSSNISKEVVEAENRDFPQGGQARKIDQSPCNENKAAKGQNPTSEPHFPPLATNEEGYQPAKSPVSAASKQTAVEDSKQWDEKDCCKENSSTGSEVDDRMELSQQNVCSQKGDFTSFLSDAQKTKDTLHDVSVSNGDAATMLVERTEFSKNHQVDGNIENIASVPDIGKFGDIANEEQMMRTTANNQLLYTDRGKCKDSEMTRTKCGNESLCVNMGENIGDSYSCCKRVAGGNGPVDESMASISTDMSEQPVLDQEAEEAACMEGEPPAIFSESSGDGVLNDRLKEESVRIVAEKLPEGESMSREKVHDDAPYTDNKKIDEHGALKDRRYECLMAKQPTLSDTTHILLEEDQESYLEDFTKLMNSSDPCSSVDYMPEDDIEMSINIDGLADLSGMNQLPPLDYDQDEQTVTVNIKLEDVKVEDISLGFSSRKVYFSMMSANESGDPVRWCLLVKFMEYCRLDKDLCSVDVEKERVVLTLPKSEASCGLWHRIFIGTSESSLQEMFFMTDHSMSELLGRLHQEENPWAKAAIEVAPAAKDEEGSEVVARRLEQLLREQEHGFTECSEASIIDEAGGSAPENPSLLTNVVEETYVDRKDMLKSRKEKKKQSRKETNSTSSDITVDVTLDELQNDVIQESIAPILTPESLSRLPVERSNSDETSLGCDAKLRSILKRSQSESANGICGDKLCGEDNPNDLFSPSPSTRVRSQSLNANAMSRPREQVGRYRNKSVSFDPEPKVCEFVEYSKKQLKKMRKQERKQTEIAAKKIEAAAKKAAGKNKGCKGGKNKHFFNGFKRDSSRSDESETETDTARETVKHATVHSEQSTTGTAKADVSKPDSIVKSPRKSKTKKNVERKDDRTLNSDSRTSPSGGRLMNPLIYELDE